MHDIGILPGGGNYSNALRINANGQVTGNALNSHGNYRAFLYDGTMHDLGTLPGYDNSWGIGINDAGTVVGSVTTTAAGQHAMLDWAEPCTT